nr:MAG TPA: hypothetical protein [Caudoviricetes sp.]
MKVDIDLQSNKCNFPECQEYEDGVCTSEEHRKDCLDIALAVLCLDKEPSNAS